MTLLDAPARREASWLEIDLAALGRNYTALRGLLAPGTHICAMVKKDAYGLGAVAVAHRLVNAGCEMLGVFSAQEAEQLLRKGITCPILLAMPLRQLSRSDVLYRHAVAEKLHLTIHDPAHLEQVHDIGQTFGMRIPVHLYVDTGMSRSGLNAGQLAAAVEALQHMPRLRLAGVCSHMACSDTDGAFCDEQLTRLTAALDPVRDRLPQGVALHLANTCAILRDRRFHLDMVRPGLGLFGYGDRDLGADAALTAEADPLQPVLRWMSRVVHIQHYPQGATVGYGSTHRLDRESVLGVVPVGYGDGYPVALGNRASVRVEAAGTFVDAPVLGRVNMDQIVIDLTPPPEVAPEVAQDVATSDAPPHPALGALVEVVSNDPTAVNSLDRLAKLADTHCYELLCRLGAHLPRIYTR